MKLIIFLLILIIIAGSVAIVYLINYSHMKFLESKITSSEETIKDYLNERYSYLEDASNIVKKVVGDEKDYFKDYLVKNNNLIKQHETLTSAFKLLYKVEDDFKKLQTNKKLTGINKKIKESDERIVAITSYYNKNAKELNEFTRKFPSKYVSKINKIKIKPIFDNKDFDKQ